MKVKMLLAVVVMALFGGQVEAAPIFTTDRSQLNGDDYIDWEILGPEGTLLSNPFSVLSQNNLAVEVSKVDPGDFKIRLQDIVGIPSSFTGNFAPGDALLWSATSPGPISLDFSTPIRGGGAQIQASQYGQFTASIEAFGSVGQSLGVFQAVDVSGSGGNNGAIFLGVSSNIDIHRIVINADRNGDAVAFAINQFDIVSATPIPEPSPLLLLGIGFLCMTGYSHRRKTTVV